MMKQDDWIAWLAGLAIGTACGMAVPPHNLLASLVGATFGSTVGAIYRYFIREK